MIDNMINRNPKTRGTLPRLYSMYSYIIFTSCLTSQSRAPVSILRTDRGSLRSSRCVTDVDWGLPALHDFEALSQNLIDVLVLMLQ
jgi:hypothetical protein